MKGYIVIIKAGDVTALSGYHCRLYLSGSPSTDKMEAEKYARSFPEGMITQIEEVNFEL